MKRILMLGGSTQQLVAIQYAKDAGYYTILCDYLADNPGQYIADKFYQESTTDKETILQIAKKENIDGIIAYASEPAAPTAAYVAEKLGLPTNPYDSVIKLCNKNLFRNFLQENKFAVPDFFSCTEITEKEKERINGMKFPIMVKPADSSGSKGVSKVSKIAELDEAIFYARKNSRNNILEIEEYIEKDHDYIIGGDVFVIEGKIVFWGFMNCLRDESVNPLVPVGKFFPSEIIGRRREILKEEMQRLITALKIKFGGLNVEAVITESNEVYFIELASRNGGNMIPDMLSVISGKNMIAASVECCIGNNNVDIWFDDNNKYFASYVLHADCNGKLLKISYSTEIKKYLVKEIIYKNEGEFVEYFDNAGKAIGIIFIEFGSKDQMYKILNHIKEHIQIFIEKRD